MRKEIKIVILWIILFIIIHFVTPNMYYYFMGHIDKGGDIFKLSTINQFFILLFGIGLIKSKESNCIEKKNSYSYDIIGILQGIILYIGIRACKDAVLWIDIGLCKNIMMYQEIGGISFKEMLYLFVIIAIVPAYCEEYFYRRAVISSVIDKKKGVFISILLFTIAHFMVGKEAMFGALFLGSVLAVQYCKYNSFTLVFMEHLMYNILEVIFTYLIRFPTDIYYISQRVSSDGECISWGVMFLEIVIVCILLFKVLNKFQKGQISNEE